MCPFFFFGVFGAVCFLLLVVVADDDVIGVAVGGIGAIVVLVAIIVRVIFLV